jgi:4-hydroxy-2-oxoheptanedioate aldolase
MKSKEFVQALANRDRVYGTLLVSSAPEYLKVVESLGLDYVFIDTEHVAADRTQVSWTCRALQAMGVAPVVRIPSPDPYEACKVLDAGACGVIAPYIESVEQVRQLVGAVKFKPLKGRLLQRVLDGEKPVGELGEYLARCNDGNALIINLESTPAMEVMEEILSVPGLDGVLIGPHDLSCSLGVPERWNDPKYTQSVERILCTAKAKGVSAGIHVIYENGIEQEIGWARMGANIILHHADILAFRFAMTRDLAHIKSALGETLSDESGESLNI